MIKMTLENDIGALILFNGIELHLYIYHFLL